MIRQRFHSYKEILGYLFRHQYMSIICIAVCMLLANLFQLVFPILTQHLIDDGINGHNLNLVYLIIGLQIILSLSKMVIEFVRGRYLIHLSSFLNLSLCSSLFSKLFRLPMGFFANHMAGDIQQRVGDQRKIQGYFSGSFLSMLFSISSIVTFSLVLFRYSRSILLLCILFYSLYLFWVFRYMKRRRMRSLEQYELGGKDILSSFELIQGIHTIKMYNAENYFFAKWNRIQTGLIGLTNRFADLSQSQQIGTLFINELKNAVVLLIAVHLIMDGKITIGGLFAIQATVMQLSAPIEQLIGMAQGLQDIHIALERTQQLHEIDSELQTGVHVKNCSFDIRIDSLEFSYPGGATVLRDLSACIPGGKITAIVGMSGCGKSTLMKLLLKYYEEYTGSIRLAYHLNAGFPAAEQSCFRVINTRSWRQKCAGVMADSYLFNDSVRNNIAMGKEVDTIRMQAICEQVNISDLIDSLPETYDTILDCNALGINLNQAA